MPDTQAPIGDNVEIPAGESRTYAYESDGGEWINLIELVAGAADAIEARVFVERSESRVDIPRTANDGEDNPADDRYTSGKRISVSTIVGETRYTTLQPLERGDRIVFRLENTDGSNAQRVRFRAAAASTLRAAIGGGS